MTMLMISAAAVLLYASTEQISLSGDGLVHMMFEAFNAHDAERVAALYAPDAIVYAPDQCQPTVGREAIQLSYQALFTEVGDVQDRLINTVVEEEQVAVRFIATSQRPGASFELPIASFMTIKNGLITEEWVYFDNDEPLSCGGTE